VIAPKAFLIGLDGATFSVLDPLMARGVMPFLGEFAVGAARAPLRTVIPPLTPPAWTSLMTGKRPGQHGVFDFFQRDAPDTEYFRLATSEDIGSATIWSLASHHGQRVISLNFPLMFPPPDVNGCVVPGGWMPWRQLRLGCHPPGLFDRLKTLPSFNPRELALDMALEAKAVDGCPEDEYKEWIELHTRREERWFEIVSYLLREEPAELVGVMFDGMDKLQHLCWRFIDPGCRPEEPTPWEQEVMDLCDRYFRRLDAMLAELVALAGSDATVILASDHGFGPTLDVFYVNAWLEQNGYLAWAGDDGGPDEQAAEVGFGEMMRHVFELDWNETVAYAATPSSQGIHVVAREPGSDRPMSPEVRRRIGAELTELLRETRHPRSGRPLVKEVWAREDAFPGPYEELAPDVSLVLEDGAAVSILRSETLVRTRAEPKGNHRSDGIFLARGPALRRGAAVGALSIVDVAPLLLYTLDLPVPVDMAGRIPEEIFDAGELTRRPPRSTTDTLTQLGREPAAPDAAYDADIDEAVAKRLRALGYIE
jgi:predicted AlkP superfamily phosphohydrolase/phosphomutase